MAILSSKEIGGNLFRLRIKARLTREQLAEKIGVTPQQIHKYETGANRMNTDKLQLIAQALDAPVQSLFTDSNETLPIAVSEKLLLDSYRAIPNKEIQESILKITTNATKHDD
jgi:transcriptional regulator with XRE-family HTH domain